VAWSPDPPLKADYHKGDEFAPPKKAAYRPDDEFDPLQKAVYQPGHDFTNIPPSYPASPYTHPPWDNSGIPYSVQKHH